MRRMLAAVGLVMVALGSGAGCTSSADSSGARNAPEGQNGDRRGVAAVPAAGAGSTHEVCESIRAAISADMTPLGSALGLVVGNATGQNEARQDQAVRAVSAALRKIGADITFVSAPATDASVRSAAAQAVAHVDALAADPDDVVGGVDSMDDIPAVTAKLTQATASIASACQGS